jgi:hypothetical protein
MSDDPTQPVAPIQPLQPADVGLAEPPVPAVAPVVPVTVVPPAKGRASSGRALNILLGVAIAVAIGGIAFAVGRSTAPVAAASNGFVREFGNGGAVPSGAPIQGQGRPSIVGRGGLTISGKVTAVTADTITIETEDGNTVEVSTSADTDYHQQAEADASDVTTGSTVSVQLDFGDGPRTGGQGGADGPLGTASDVTVIP